jgi:competence protein ComEA
MSIQLARWGCALLCALTIAQGGASAQPIAQAEPTRSSAPPDHAHSTVRPDTPRAPAPPDKAHPTPPTPSAHAPPPTPNAHATPPTPSAHAPPPSAPGVVNINTASSAELERLPGIGPAKARAILELRARLTRFARIEDLLRVKGIGRATFRKLRPYLALQGDTSLRE